MTCGAASAVTTLTPISGIPNIATGAGPLRWPAPFLSRAEEVECLRY
jgi:hypothetical protein